MGEVRIEGILEVQVVKEIIVEEIWEEMGEILEMTGNIKLIIIKKGMFIFPYVNMII